MLIRRVIVASALVLASHGWALAQDCERNFKVSGVPLVTALSYKTWQEFPKLKPETALQRLAQDVAAQGFSGIKVNKSLGAIDAYQETTGSGRIQTLRVVARKRGAGTRVDAIFNAQAGQVTTQTIVREVLCSIVRSATE